MIWTPWGLKSDTPRPQNLELGTSIWTSPGGTPGGTPGDESADHPIHHISGVSGYIPLDGPGGGGGLADVTIWEGSKLT